MKPATADDATAGLGFALFVSIHARQSSAFGNGVHAGQTPPNEILPRGQRSFGQPLDVLRDALPGEGWRCKRAVSTCCRAHDAISSANIAVIARDAAIPELGSNNGPPSVGPPLSEIAD